MIYYASRTGTKRNLKAMKDAGIRILVVPPDGMRTEGFPHYAIDNGAWGSFQQGTPWDEDVFVEALRVLGRGADWVVLPDIVEGGLASLERSLSWVARCRKYCSLVLLPVQDGMTLDDVRPHVGERVGLFVGGSSEWKVKTIPLWGRFAQAEDLWLHVGRVNSAKRIKSCTLAGVTSVDGTSPSRYAVTVPRIRHACSQMALMRGV